MKNFLRKTLPPSKLQNYLGITSILERIDRLENRLLSSSEGAPAGVQHIELDYAIHPIPRYGEGKPPHPILYEIIDRNRDSYRTTLQDLLSLKETFFKIPVSEPRSAQEPQWLNNWLPGLDGASIYYFLWSQKPKRYFEVGSGNSTKFARKAITDHNLPTQILSIDPQPRAEIDPLCDRVIRQPLEDASLDIFDELDAGDILFIDNSHRIFTNSDANVFFLDILPRLKPGILVEIHDIFLPYDYPSTYNHLFYSEQYMLAAYLLAQGSRFDILLPNTFISYDRELDSLLDPLWFDPIMNGSERHGCSFWLRTR